MIAVSVLLILLTLVVLALSYFDFRGQRKKCQKYPLYQLRDDIILALVEEGKTDSLLKTYDIVNKTIERLHVFNFSFFINLNVEILREIFERTKNGKSIDPKYELNKYEIKFVSYIMCVARKNSLLIHCASTKIGKFFLLMPVIVRFFGKHRSLILAESKNTAPKQKLSSKRKAKESQVASNQTICRHDVISSLEDYALLARDPRFAAC